MNSLIELGLIIQIIIPGPYNLEELSKTAMPVKPERMSLPEEAGIIDPRDFLKGRNLEIFTNMAEVVPHDIPPPNPTKAVLKKLHRRINSGYTEN